MTVYLYARVSPFSSVYICMCVLVYSIAWASLYACLFYIINVLRVYFVWSGHPRLVSLICTPENTHVSYTFKLSIACLPHRLIIECLVDTLERYVTHSITHASVPLSLHLWTPIESSEFTKFSAINYHPVIYTDTRSILSRPSQANPLTSRVAFASRLGHSTP